MRQNNTIGNRLKQIRLKLNKSQIDFSTILQTKQQNLSRYENGQLEIPDSIKIKLHNIGINMNWLLTGKGNMFAENNAQNQDIEKIKLFLQKIQQFDQADWDMIDVIKSAALSNEKKVHLREIIIKTITALQDGDFNQISLKDSKQ